MSTNDPIEERRAANLRRAAAQFEEQRRGPPGHPTGRGACDPEEAPCSGCAAAYSEAWAEPDGDDGADAAPDGDDTL